MTRFVTEEGDGFMNRALRFAVLTMAACVLVALAAAPAYAAHFDGMIYRIAPIGNAPISGTTRIEAGYGWDTSTIRRYAASNKATKFYIIDHVDESTGQQVPKRVSRNTFVKYVRAGGSAAWFDWRWKRDSKGRKYRYINRITASKFAG